MIFSENRLPSLIKSGGAFSGSCSNVVSEKLELIWSDDSGGASSCGGRISCVKISLGALQGNRRTHAHTRMDANASQSLCGCRQIALTYPSNEPKHRYKPEERL